jgi:hypothetical protein
LEEIARDFFKREYEELGPSICRVMEIQMNGYISLKEHPNPLFRIRAREYKKLSLEIYPLLKTAINEAPSQKVKNYLLKLKEKAEEEFKISFRNKMVGLAVPLLKKYTELRDVMIRHPQPPVEINRYRYN